MFYVIAKNGLSEDAKIIQTEFDNAEGYEIIEACIHLVEFSKKQKAQDYLKLLEKSNRQIQQNRCCLVL